MHVAMIATNVIAGKVSGIGSPPHVWRVLSIIITSGIFSSGGIEVKTLPQVLTTSPRESQDSIITLVATPSAHAM
jgi:hypothetical protein